MNRAYVTINLTPDEILQGAIAGILRHVENLAEGFSGRTHGLKKNSGLEWQLHIDGALTEMAVAKYFNLDFMYWSGKGTRGAADVQNFEVRSSQDHNNRLILHPEDKDESIFVFITGLNGSYRIHGWIKAAEGKKREYWPGPNENRPAYYVPQDKLALKQKKKAA